MRFFHSTAGEAGQQTRSRDLATAFLDLGDQLRSHWRRSPEKTPVSEEGVRTLLGAIEGEIIPRLLLAHREAGESAPAALRPEDRARFLETVMSESAASSRRVVDDLLQRGVPQEEIFLDLLTHAARRLGEMWERDVCSFAEVTIGLCRLHQIVRDLGVYEDPRVRPEPDAPRVLLATACGDQHVFGVVMVAEFFRRAGWRVWSEPGASRAQTAALLAKESFDLLAISVACSSFAEEVAAEIRALRKASCNVDLKVLVGGRLLLETPSLAESVGADGSAVDARIAPSVGNELLACR